MCVCLKTQLFTLFLSPKHPQKLSVCVEKPAASLPPPDFIQKTPTFGHSLADGEMLHIDGLFRVFSVMLGISVSSGHELSVG